MMINSPEKQAAETARHSSYTRFELKLFILRNSVTSPEIERPAIVFFSISLSNLGVYEEIRKGYNCNFSFKLILIVISIISI